MSIEIARQVIMVKSNASVLVHLGADDVGEVEGLLVILTVKDELKFPIRHLYICREIPIIKKVVVWKATTPYSCVFEKLIKILN